MTETVSGTAIGIVVIGRNEGDRLKRCLRSVCAEGRRAVYVDSGSTDGSQEFAKSMGVDVVDLDMSIPFTMPRARNAGFERLLETDPDIESIQFVDGDCEVVEGWIDRALSVLESEAEVAAVCGQRRERHPEESIYNRLCDMEWYRLAGYVPACGGDVLMRAKPLVRVGGYNPAMIAGEEAELCFRLRADGWKIKSLNEPMTLHDAGMHRFGQWFKRTIRGGHAYAEGAKLHSGSPERFQIRQTRSALVWGALLPLVGIAGLASTALNAWVAAVPLFIGLLFAMQFLRVRRRMKRQRDPEGASLYALFVVLGKFPQAIGVMRYWLGRVTGRRSGLIEYK